MWNRIRAWFGGRMDPPGPRFIIHHSYELPGALAAYDGRRPFRILSYLEKRRLLRQGMVRRPRPASLKRLQRVHDPDYIRALEEPGALTEILGLAVGPEVEDRFLGFQRAVCGGTLRATRLALQRRRVAMNLGGGLHHAGRSRGSGFCVFNDVALAIDALRDKGHDFPVLVVDLDVHDGDGTRSIFADDPTVHTFSIHNQDLGSTDAVASTSIALGADVEDEAYLAAIREHLPPVVAQVRPGCVFYLAGADPALDDRLGNWRISLDGLLARDRFVLEQIGMDRVRGGDTACVILTAGGYGPRAWRHGAALGSWLLTGDARLDIPLDHELPVGHYRRIVRLMKNPDHGAPDDTGNGDDWGLTPDEFAGAAGGRETRFLGHISHHGIELLLEESGLLERLRKRGYKELSVVLELDDPLGHTLRIVTGGATPLVLLELRLRVDRTALPGRTLLMVEWLLIQDAEHRFEMTRPLLPGQTYPGLGLLRDTAAVLIVACERLELDGLAFTPSHYHLARLSRPQARCADPEREGWFRAVFKAVRHLHLNEAVAVVEGGGLEEVESARTVEWKPSLLVIPVSGDLRSYFGAGPWETAAQAAAQELRARLR